MATVTEVNGRTRVELRSVPHEAPESERGVFAGAHGDMRSGWEGTFARLDAHLVSPR